jgi:hypothetical protein
MSILIGCVVAAAGSGCGSERRTDTSSEPAAGGQAAKGRDAAAAERRRQQVAEDADVAIDDGLIAMREAARRKDLAGVRRAQREIERAAGSRPSRASAAKDPFERELEQFAYKRAPLFVQQTTQTQDSHVVFAGVDRATFCLQSPAARLAAVNGTYRPVDRRLRAAGVKDFEFVVVSLSQTASTIGDALAIGRGGQARLTRRGRSC